MALSCSKNAVDRRLELKHSEKKQRRLHLRNTMNPWEAKRLVWNTNCPTLANLGIGNTITPDWAKCARSEAI